MVCIKLIPYLILNSSINSIILIFLTLLPHTNTKRPEINERRVFEFINSQEDPVSFHRIQKFLDMSPGGLQATVVRCLKPDAKFKIYEGKKISKKNNRAIRVFSVNPSKILALNIPHISVLHDLYKKVILGDVFEVENNYVLPLSMDEKTTKILMQLISISPKYESIGDLFSQAMMKYLKESISKDLIGQAIQNLNKNQNQKQRKAEEDLK